MPTYTEVPDLLYKGVKVYTLQDDTATPTPPTSDPVTPAPTVISFVADLVQLNDAMYLYKMQTAYASALKSLPGSHQVFFDMLTDRFGRTYWKLTGFAQQALQVTINRLINWAGSDHSADLRTFDVNTYTGPLKQIYNNLVAAKLSGKA